MLCPETCFSFKLWLYLRSGHLINIICEKVIFTFSLILQTLPQTTLSRGVKSGLRSSVLPSPLSCAMPKSDAWPGGVAMESLSNMDSAGSCDSVISMNSAYVSAAVQLPFQSSFPLTLFIVRHSTVARSVHRYMCFLGPL